MPPPKPIAAPSPAASDEAAAFDNADSTKLSPFPLPVPCAVPLPIELAPASPPPLAKPLDSAGEVETGDLTESFTERPAPACILVPPGNEIVESNAIAPDTATWLPGVGFGGLDELDGPDELAAVVGLA